VPELWVCGTSAGSARLAARLGACFAFHDFLNRSRPQPADGPAAVEIYRSEFRPDDHLASPKFNVAVYGLCADSEERARRLWRQAPEPGFCGSPERCREQLLELADRYGTDELVVQSMTDDLDARLESYRLLAEALEL
jgi:alkanesulfonate monooxygenase SsuD/methylene tetrahydromethanopterin reductase-like flavin-dependent oxidoreductase (luciferase family)